jgi:hypothetical protein
MMGHHEIQNEIERSFIEPDEVRENSRRLKDAILGFRKFPADGRVENFLAAPLESRVGGMRAPNKLEERQDAGQFMSKSRALSRGAMIVKVTNAMPASLRGLGQRRTGRDAVSIPDRTGKS